MESKMVSRLQAEPAAGVGAIAGGILAAAVGDPFFYLAVILIVSNLADWIFGRHAARARGEYSTTKSRHGLLSKASQLVVLLIVRTLEAVLSMAGVEWIEALASSMLALALIVEDLESIDRHNVALGGRPMPVLGRILKKLRTVTGSDRRAAQRSNAGEPIPPPPPKESG